MEPFIDLLGTSGPFNGTRLIPSLHGIWDVGLLGVPVVLAVLGLWWWTRFRRNSRAGETSKPSRTKVSDDQLTMHAIAENANDGLVFQDMSGRILWANQAYCTIMDRDLEEILGRNPQEFCFPPELKPSDEEIANFRFNPNDETFGSLHRHPNIRKNGDRFWHEFSQAMVELRPGEQRVILVSRDVTQQVMHAQELERTRADLVYAAHHDALTALPNRTAFMTAAGAILKDQTASARRLGLLYVDLNGFKAINDTFGHAAGDKILIHVADSIRAVSQNIDLSCRMGGDEYVMACQGIGGFNQLQFIADDLLDRINTPIAWGDTQLKCGASIGLAISDHTTPHAEDLIRSADFALYEAKKPGSPSVARYDAELHARQEADREILQEFSDALDADAISFVYQPVFDVAECRIASFETLARWRRANGVVVPPDKFLPFAQRLNRIADIDFAAIGATASLTADLRAKGHRIRGAFNTSSAALAHPDFMARVDLATSSAGLEPRHLTAEVLETTFFGPCTTDSMAAARIKELRESGYQVYLDDFGVGYAGLAHLGQLDITGIKIDRSLVADVVFDKSNRIIVSSILKMCDELGVRSLAEGIETAEQADLLITKGCLKLQGFGIAKPMPRERLVAMIQDQVQINIPSQEKIARAG